MSPGRAINCNHVQDLLDDYRRGKLLPGQRQMIAEHLQSCSACTTELEMREAIANQLVAALPDASAPQDLSPQVRAAITAAARQRNPMPRRHGSSLLPLMLTAAVVLVSAVAMYQLKRPMATRDAVIATHHETATLRREIQPTNISDRRAMEAVPAPEAKAAASPGIAAAPEQARDAAANINAEAETLAMADATADKEYFYTAPAASPPPSSTQMGMAGAVQKSQPAPAEGAMAARQAFARADAQEQNQTQITPQDADIPVQQDKLKTESVHSTVSTPAAMAGATTAEETRTRFFAAKPAPATTGGLSTSTLATTVPALHTTATAATTSATTHTRESDQR